MTSRVCFAILLSCSVALAQSESINQKVRIRISFSGEACDTSAHVTLIGHAGPIGEASPNDQCRVDFNIPDGTYHVRISRRNSADTDDLISVSAGSSDFEIKVPKEDESVRMGMMALSPSVSVGDLRVPEKAQRELENATKQIHQQDFTKAIKTLHHAIDDYPNYAGAYNNLGVVYARLGDRQHEREALEKAVSLNDRLAPAYANLARLSIKDKDFASAEEELKKAAHCDPADGITLVLLAYSQFMQKEMDKAIATSREAHALKSPHAFVHQIAARAFEQKRDRNNAMAELELFLDEETLGARADSARKELALLQAIPTNRASNEVQPRPVQ